MSLKWPMRQELEQAVGLKSFQLPWSEKKSNVYFVSELNSISKLKIIFCFEALCFRLQKQSYIDCTNYHHLKKKKSQTIGPQRGLIKFKSKWDFITSRFVCN